MSNLLKKRKKMLPLKQKGVEMLQENRKKLT
jgi:hypothetical protein